MIYIGQTRNGLNRIENHNQSKDFWDTAILFLASKDVFNLDMIAGLEKFAINEAHKINRYQIENEVVPKYEISTEDEYIIEQYYKEIVFVMASQGYKLFPILDNKEKNIVTPRIQEPLKPIINNYNNLYHIRSNLSKAFLEVVDDKYILKAGAILLAEKPSFMTHNMYYCIKRREIIAKMTKNIDGKIILQQDIVCDTPSFPATIVLGRAASGNEDWLDSNNAPLKRKK